MGVPYDVLIGELSLVPTHTAVEMDGVKPTVQASLFCPRIRLCVVPVLVATGRPPYSGMSEELATLTIDSVTLRATCGSIRCSPRLLPPSKSTRPSAVSTLLIMCGAWYSPSAAKVAYAEAMSPG